MSYIEYPAIPKINGNSVEIGMWLSDLSKIIDPGNVFAAVVR